jgi:hypothetical protein
MPRLVIVGTILTDVGTAGAGRGCSEEGGTRERSAWQAGPTRQREPRGARRHAVAPTGRAHLAAWAGEGV